MKKTLWLTFLAFAGLVAYGQADTPKTNAENTLLWRISGKNLAKPSYLFGTMHMICADDIALSDSLVAAIGRADKVFLELDMDNMFEMIGAMGQMKMRNDTTLRDLLTEEEYKKVKEFFTKKNGLIPFAMLETYKPMLASSMIIEMQGRECDAMISMEELVMKEARKNNIGISGLETVGYQLSIFDSIPYQLQAKQLLKMIESGGDGGAEIREVTDAYRNQQLEKMDELTRKEDMGIANFTDLLLYKRNRNWARKLDGLLAG
ncbi:MAG TPA: TraB/GumN family protein, partial [Flavisolibacter sp.]